MENLKEIFGLLRRLISYDQTTYKGSFDELSLKIVQSRWTGEYFQAGESPRINQFWIRDFSFCLLGLLEMGFIQECNKNLEWAINNYIKSGKITTTITSSGKCIDIFHYSIDSLPFLLYCIRTLNRADLIKANLKFFNSQILQYYYRTFENTENHIQTNKPFSQPKDIMVVNGTCVANTFLCMTVGLLEEFRDLQNPFPKSKELIDTHIKIFWKEDHFVNDISGSGIKSSDSNIWPFWSGIVDDKNKLKKSLRWIESSGFIDPFPIRYHKQKYSKYEHILNKIFLRNYQGSSIWTMNAPIYLELLYTVDKEKAKTLFYDYLDRIEEWQDYFEVIDPDTLKPLKGFWKLGSDKGMLWISMMYRLKKIFK